MPLLAASDSSILMPINSRAKGARGEREWRDCLNEAGFQARRGQQFAGGTDSPDVVCEALGHLHFEVKCVENLNLGKAMQQAINDAKTKIPVVAHKKNHGAWHVTMLAKDWLEMQKQLAQKAETM